LIQINKGNEPTELKNHRCKKGATYDANDWDKEALRKALFTAQGAICAFCMQRIQLENTRIAHIKCQATNPKCQLMYANMVLACPGGEVPNSKNDTSKYHCDKAQEWRDLKCNPSNVSDRIEARLSYLANGEIQGADSDIKHDIEALNLNGIEYIKSGRKAVLDRFQRSIPPGTMSINWIDRQLAFWSSRNKDNELKPYCGVILYYLRQKKASNGTHRTSI